MDMRLGVSLIAGTVALACAAGSAEAATWTVTDGSSNAATACDQATHTCVSLRAAVAAAEATKGEADEISVLSGGTIQLTDDLVIASDMTITGVSARSNVIDGSGKYRGFRIAPGATVSISRFTVRNGAASVGSTDGGGILNQGTTVLSDVRVTGSHATRGGGIANVGTSTSALLGLVRVLVDDNTAGDGGGIANVGGSETTPYAYLALADSTVFANTATSAGGTGGIASRQAGSLLALQRATIADNVGALRGVGGLTVSAERASVLGTILARNRVGAETINCGSTPLIDAGANLEDGETCGVPTADPRLATALTNAGGETDLLPIPADSPAVDSVTGDVPPAAGGGEPVPRCPAQTTDQRGVPRPQGAACDAGAYEYAAPATTTITGGPAGPTSDPSPSFTFATSGATQVACRLDGPGGAVGTFAACTSPRAFSGLAPGDYVFVVQVTNAAGEATITRRAFSVTAPQAATPTVAPAQTPAPIPPPVPNVSVVAQPSGTVLVRRSGRSGFTRLDPSLIRNGDEVDARKGSVEITRADGGKARFSDGIFKLSHSGGVTTLTLTEKLTCPKPKRAASAAKKVKTRKLWGDGKGKFRTKGKYSAATVRGTRWLVQDTCTTTRTRVTTGAVTVEDFAKKKRVVVRKGKPYIARAKKR